MGILKSTKQTARKTVACTHCGGESEVGHKALSVFCPHCRKRLIIQDFKIKTYHSASEFSTCGSLVVERKGHVVAPIIVGDLVVKGKVQGRVTSRGPVLIGKTGWLKGDLQAPRLCVEPGGVIIGFVRIGALDMFPLPQETGPPPQTARPGNPPTAVGKPGKKN